MKNQATARQFVPCEKGYYITGDSRVMNLMTAPGSTGQPSGRTRTMSVWRSSSINSASDPFRRRMRNLKPSLLEAAEVLLGSLAICLACAGCAGEAPAQAPESNPQMELDLALRRVPAAESPLDACGPNRVNWVTDLDVLPSPAQPEPAPRTAYIDPVYGTCVLRISDRANELSPDDPSEGLKNEYSRVQSFNSDGSLLLLRSIESNWYLYDAASLERLAQLPLVVEPRWDAVNPHLIRTFDGTRLMALDLDSGLLSLEHDFAADFPGTKLAAVWTRYEGSPSFDGNTWGLIVQDADWNSIALLVYDLSAGRVLAVRELQPGLEIDAVTISPLGGYLLVYHDEICEPGRLGDPQHPCGLMVYDRNLQGGRGLLPVVGHSDTALDAAGREVLVFQDIQNDELSMLDLESGEITPLLSIDFSHSPLGFHFSGKASSVPGWVVISTHEGARPAATWMDDIVFALELKRGGRVVRLASTHSLVDSTQEHDCWAEPHASVNQDFTRVIFTSNWGRSGTGEVEAYMVVLPPGWIDALP
jgi:hypothetical protein